MEITLTLDDELVARARACAERRQTTLDGLVKEFVQEGCRRAAIAEFVRLSREHAGRSEPGWRFNREEIYDRPILKRD
jgi:hypothetical protein